MNDSNVLTRGLSTRQLIRLDVAVAVMYTIVRLNLTAVRTDAVLPLLLVAGIGLPLAVRRLWPVPVFTVVMALTVLAEFPDMPGDFSLAAAYALYPVALARPHSRWVPTPVIGALSGIVLVGGTTAGPKDWHGEGIGLVLPSLAVLGTSWTVGRVLRERRAHAARSALQLADQAVSDERLRIARELHDVVAHSMSLIAVKAGVAVHVAEARPKEALDALRVIEATSRGTLTEMRHLLGVLRTGTAPEAELAPVPGLAGLPGLVEHAAMAGVRVDLELKVVPLPEGVEVSAYRIVQEALTNVVKHAAPAHCRVVVHADGHEVRIEVTDDGPGVRVLPTGPGEGHGLIGMRERVMMYGGDFTAGPRPEGGFAVSARLPYEPTESTP